METDVELLTKWQKSPIAYIGDIWGLSPQPVLPQYVEQLERLISEGNYDEIRASWFESFIKGTHIAWEQWLILRAIERSLQGIAPKRISVASGHGIGKSTTMAWLIFWFLTCFENSQIPVTAPTSEQMHDVLWKEVALWHQRMPKEFRELFEWSNFYIRVIERPETWFARAKTARKEAPEALAGVHGDHVMYLVDEASGVPEEIFNTAEGALTGQDTLFVMISNPTRLMGYFYASHHTDKAAWQRMTFSSAESPIVEQGYVSRIATKHGEESDEYRIRVQGIFPQEDAMDEKGYVPLLVESDLHLTRDLPVKDLFIGRTIMGIDPSGEGEDTTEWVVRDQFKAKRVHTEQKSTAKGIAAKTLVLMDFYGVAPEDVYIDNFGEGANVAKEIALSSHHYDVNAVNMGDGSDNDDKDDTQYANMRAESFWRLKGWARTGGELVSDKSWKDELLTIRYCRVGNGKVKIKPKLEMRKDGIPSPNVADALALTFYSDGKPKHTTRQFKATFRRAS